MKGREQAQWGYSTVCQGPDDWIMLILKRVLRLEGNSAVRTDNARKKMAIFKLGIKTNFDLNKFLTKF